MDAAEILKRSLADGVEFSDVQIGYEQYEPPGTLSVEISPLGITNDVVVNLKDEKENELALSLDSIVQGVEYYDTYTHYEELQDVPRPSL